MATDRRHGRATLWRLLTEEHWLLLATLPFLEYDGDDVHRLWLLAIEDDLTFVRVCVERHCAVSISHARNLAMAHSWWTALAKIPVAKRKVRHMVNRVLQKQTVDRILDELHRLHVPSHPHRRHALETIAESWEWCSSPYLRLAFTHRDYGSVAASGAPLSLVVHAAARNGNLESVVWLHHFAIYHRARALEEAAIHGHVDVVSWLLAQPNDDHGVTVGSRECDDPEHGVMAWRADRTRHTMSRKWGYTTSRDRYEADTLAAKAGDMQGVQRLVALGPLFDSRLVVAAASAGRLAVLEYLHRHAAHLFELSDALLCAVKGGHLEVAQWLVATTATNRIGDARIIQAAIDGGHTPVLQWMKDAAQGSVDDAGLLPWLIKEVNFQVTIENAKAAVGRQDTELAKWIVTRYIDSGGAFRPADTGELLQKAITSANFELVEWFIEEHRFWSDRAFLVASIGPSVSVLKYVYDTARTRSPLDSAALVPPVWLYLVPDSLATFAWLVEYGFRDALLANHHSLDLVKSIERDATRKQRQLGAYEYLHGPRYVELDPRRKSYTSPDLYTLRRVLALIIELYDPEIVRSVRWLPGWAVQQRKLGSLQRLAEIGHPTVFSHKLFNRVVVEMQDEAIVRWYIQKRPELFSTRVVQWGVKHSKTTFLSWVFQVYIPRNHTTHEDTQLLRQCVRAAIYAAAKHGRDDILRALPRWTVVANDPALWHGVRLP